MGGDQFDSTHINVYSVNNLDYISLIMGNDKELIPHSF